MRWLLIVLLAGCANVRTDAGGGHASVQVEGRSAAALVAAGVFLAAATEDLREPRPFPSFSSAFSDWLWGEPKPDLDPTRSVNEQDCTRPVALEGNLKCR